MLVLLEMIKRNAYRIGRNFAALVLIQITVDFLLGPIFYFENMLRNGWYLIAGWQLEMMFTSPILNIVEFALMAFLIQIFWEFFRGFWVITKVVIDYARS